MDLWDFFLCYYCCWCCLTISIKLFEEEEKKGIYLKEYFKKYYLILHQAKSEKIGIFFFSGRVYFDSHGKRNYAREMNIEKIIKQKISKVNKNK